MDVSGAQNAAQSSVLRQVLGMQTNTSTQQVAKAQQSSQNLQQQDGDGDHGVEPSKGQHIDVRA